MKKNPASQSGIFHPRILLAFALCGMGATLTILAVATPTPSSSRASASLTGAAVPLASIAPVRADTVAKKVFLNDPMTNVSDWLGSLGTPSALKPSLLSRSGDGPRIAAQGSEMVNTTVGPRADVTVSSGVTGQCELARSPAGDASNTAPGGDGGNLDNLDIVGVATQPGADSSTVFNAVIVVKNLSLTIPINANRAVWYFQWTVGLNTPNASYYFASASIPPADPSGSTSPVDFFVGTYDPFRGIYQNTASASGTYTTGPNGSFVIAVPTGALPGLTSGTLLSQTYATSWVGQGALGGGVVYNIDSAPKANTAFGANYHAGTACSGMPISGTWIPVTGAQPYPRVSVGMAYDESTQTVLLFGGFSAETWLWDGMQWTQLATSPSPVARYGPSMVYDPRSQTILMFGGEATEGPNYGSAINDTWSWNGRTRQWTQLFPAHSPSPRDWAGMAYDAATSQMVLFGGNDIGTSELADTWIWDGNDWILQATALGPPPRLGQGMAYDAARGNLVMFGGCCLSLNDTWIWTGTVWEPRLTNTAPDARYGSAMTYHAASGKVVLFSGVNGIADTWTWDGTNWEQLSPAHSPPARFFPGATYDAARNVVVVFGGQGSSGLLDDQWNWTGNDWQQVLSERPAPRTSPAFVYDPAHDEYVLFGGAVTSPDFSQTTYTNETWTFRSSRWTPKTPATSPPPQRRAEMAYDPSLGKLVMLSICDPCADPNNPLAETWTWDGSNWTKLNLATEPPAREAEAMAYDPGTGNIVMFGGNAFCSTCFSVNDTWVFRNGTWTELHPANSPPPRLGAAFTWDPGLGRMILFSGRHQLDINGDPHLPDTWVWDGTDWTELTSPISPVQRELTRGIFDSRSGVPIEFGGFYNGQLGDTWTLRNGEWVQLYPPTSPQPRWGFGLAESSTFSGPMLFGGFSGQSRNDLWTFVSGSDMIPLSVVSRKTHGSAGAFDVNLPLTGNAGIECRSGGTGNAHQIVITFVTPVTFTSASVTAGSGTVASTSTSGTKVTLNLTNVSNAQRITVTLTGVNDGINTGNVAVQMGVLVGDTTANGSVNSSDISQTKAQSGTAATSDNFRTDVTVNGLINSSDISLVKSKSGTGL